MDKFISVGNEAMVSAFDVLDYLRDDPHTDCVMLYLEGIDDGRHFLEAAKRTTPQSRWWCCGAGSPSRGTGGRLAHRAPWPAPPPCSMPLPARRAW